MTQEFHDPPPAVPLTKCRDLPPKVPPSQCSTRDVADHRQMATSKELWPSVLRRTVRLLEPSPGGNGFTDNFLDTFKEKETKYNIIWLKQDNSKLKAPQAMTNPGPTPPLFPALRSSFGYRSPSLYTGGAAGPLQSIHQQQTEAGEQELRGAV